MLDRIDPAQRDWFAAWVARDDGWLPAAYPRRLTLLHPGAEPVVDDADVPARGPSSVEGQPAPEQKAALDKILLSTTGADAAACLASYDATPDLAPAPPLDVVSERVSGYVDYLLVAAPLGELVFKPWEMRWPYEQPVTMLWPADRSWCLSADPDSPFTVVGCDDHLAASLLAESILRAVELT